MKIYEGTIITCDAENHIYKYLVEDAGTIVYVGDEVPAEYRNAPGMKLGKRALIPSFADTHIHFASYAAFHAGLNVMDAKSNEEILEMLDRVCPDKPVFMVKYDGHTCVVNTKLLEQALTVEEALKMCTYNGYYTTFDEKERGSLEKGKVADMVVLSENPFAVEKERLGEIKVERLLLQGRPYKKIGLNPFAQIIKGMVRKAGC